MCLIVVGLGVTPRYPLLVAANRDEQHVRPTRAAVWWPDLAILGGRDELAGGTWLAVDRRGRLAAVTNVRDAQPRAALHSRGALATEFLTRSESAEVYATHAGRDGHRYGPFNLLLFDGTELYYTSNRAPAVRLGPGLHAFSNAPHGQEWPKVSSAREGATALLDEPAPLEPLFELLADRAPRAAADERYRSAHFIVGPAYGTRCSTVVLGDAAGGLTFVERTFDSGARLVGEVRESFRRSG
jgi:uncharacterized protein with NRDE domain